MQFTVKQTPHSSPFIHSITFPNTFFSRITSIASFARSNGNAS